ncbi:MAG: hypothetical protein Q4G68_10295 [Planctomycetia bacterium]|nr:hypothetical protein [Planctomycetia bacterium]
MSVCKKISLGTAIFLALIVVLRVGIGCHFLYEGLWKMVPANGFSAKGFLGMAKGPTKELYYIMLPDLDGEDRLTIAKAYAVREDGKQEQKDLVGVTLPVIEKQWYDWFGQFLNHYELESDQRKEANQLFNQYITSLREYTLEKQPDIMAFLGSKKRYKESIAFTTDGAEHQKIRDWDRQMTLRREGAALAEEPEKMGENMQLALWNLLTAEQRSFGKLPPITYGANKIPLAGLIIKLPVIKDFATPSRLGFLDLTVTLGLSAIGICLMLGFCNRLAALAGAAFMVNICLSQFPWPTVYPYPPEVVGHSMIFNKDSVEMIALLVLASLPAGRWGGLDWFLWNFAGKRFLNFYGFKKDPLGIDLDTDVPCGVPTETKI